MVPRDRDTSPADILIPDEDERPIGEGPDEDQDLESDEDGETDEDQIGDEDLDDEAELDADDFEPPALDDIEGVLARYGNNPQKLAAAYTNLQRRFGRMGTELGEARKTAALAKKVLQQQGGDAEGNGKGDLKERAKRRVLDAIKKAEESGQDPTEAMLEALFGAVTEHIEGATRPIETQMQRAHMERLWSAYTARNPRAAKLEPVMTRILKENPGVLPLDRGPEAFQRGLGMLYREAERRAQKARISDRASATLDGGRPERKRGSDQTGRQRAAEATERARKTGKAVDVVRALEQRLHPLRSRT